MHFTTSFLAAIGPLLLLGTTTAHQANNEPNAAAGKPSSPLPFPAVAVPTPSRKPLEKNHLTTASAFTTSVLPAQQDFTKASTAAAALNTGTAAATTDSGA